MSRYSAQGVCETCSASFRYFLIDTEANASLYAYCDRCGATALLPRRSERAPPGVDLTLPPPLARPLEDLLAPCPCGGRFRGHASPRCPDCRAELSPRAARAWLEANAPATQRGWEWQSSWQGSYCIVIENQVHADVWSP